MRPSGPRYPHPIRLRGPWHYEVLETDASATATIAQRDVAPCKQPAPSQPLPRSSAHGGAASSGRLRLPADWSSVLGHDFRGRVRFTRHFHRPQGLDAHERVWLVCEGADAQASWQVNNHELPPIHGYALRCEADITAWLEPRNVLQLDVELSSDATRQLRPGRQQQAGGPIGEVRLEVRAEHWIDALAINAVVVADRPLLEIGGRVRGPSASAPLELTVEADGHELAWLPCESEKEFSLSLPLEQAPSWPEHRLRVRVRLLGGGQRLWQSVRTTGIRPVQWASRPQPTLEILGRPYPLPWPRFAPHPLDEIDAWPTRWLQQATRHGLVLDVILPEPAYNRLDELGGKIIQAMPARWAADVCPRLAHHPSIVAWYDPEPPAPNQSVDGSAPASRHGRLWLPSSVVLPAAPTTNQPP